MFYRTRSFFRQKRLAVSSRFCPFKRITELYLCLELLYNENIEKKSPSGPMNFNKQRNRLSCPILALKFTIYHKIDLFATAWGHFLVSAKLFYLSGHFYRTRLPDFGCVQARWARPLKSLIFAIFAESGLFSVN